MRNSTAYFTCLAFLAQILLFPLPAYGQSQDSDSEEDPPVEQVTTLRIGDPAPFAGTLFSTAATARMLAELELSRESCDLRIGEAVERKEAELQLTIDQLQIRLDSNTEIYNQRILIRDSQISFLQEQMSPPRWYEHPGLWVAIGVVVGAGATIGVTYAVNTP